MIDKNKISEVNHRIAIRNNINCVWKIVLLTIIVALIAGLLIIICEVATIKSVSDTTNNNDDIKTIAIIELVFFIILAIVYLSLTIYWILQAIKKNNQATSYDRDLNIDK